MASTSEDRYAPDSRSSSCGPSASEEGFTLYELRRMRAAGQLSDEEFERAKALIIGRVGGSASARNEIGPQDDDRESCD